MRVATTLIWPSASLEYIDRVLRSRHGLIVDRLHLHAWLEPAAGKQAALGDRADQHRALLVGRLPVDADPAFLILRVLVDRSNDGGGGAHDDWSCALCDDLAVDNDHHGTCAVGVSKLGAAATYPVYFRDLGRDIPTACLFGGERVVMSVMSDVVRVKKVSSKMLPARHRIIVTVTSVAVASGSQLQPAPPFLFFNLLRSHHKSESERDTKEDRPKCRMPIGSLGSA